MPKAVDLCCGKGGWTIGLLDTGWDVIGFDTENHRYPAQLVLQDVRTLDGKRFWGKIDLVVASPPCQEFSYRSFPFKRCRYLRDNVPPDTSIWDACMQFARDAGVPIILENVRGAVRYMGRPSGRFGPFYLWGDVPVLLPDGKPQKGFGKVEDRVKRGPLNAKRDKNKRGPLMCRNRDGYKRMDGSAKYSGKSRKEWSAKAAMIPYELAHWIGTVFKPNGIF